MENAYEVDSDWKWQRNQRATALHYGKLCGTTRRRTEVLRMLRNGRTGPSFKKHWGYQLLHQDKKRTPRNRRSVGAVRGSWHGLLRTGWSVFHSKSKHIPQCTVLGVGVHCVLVVHWIWTRIRADDARMRNYPHGLRVMARVKWLL